MTDHADTIRRDATPEVVYAASREEAQRLLDESYLAKFRAVPIAEWESLLAELQQAQEDLDRTTTAANRIEQQLVQAAEVVTELRAELRQAQKERDRIQEIALKNAQQFADEQDRCEQAIDALREIATGTYDSSTDAFGRARAALVSLGEQPQ